MTSILRRSQKVLNFLQWAAAVIFIIALFLSPSSAKTAFLDGALFDKLQLKSDENLNIKGTTEWDISTDGEKLAFVDPETRALKVYVFPLKKIRGIFEIKNKNEYISSPGWSGNSQKVIFCLRTWEGPEFDPEKNAVWMYGFILDTAEVYVPDHAAHPRWASTSNKFLFARFFDSGEIGGLQVVDIDKKTYFTLPSRITFQSVLYEFDRNALALSKSADKLVFNMKNNFTGKKKIFIFDHGKMKISPIIFKDQEDPQCNFFAWSPEANKVLGICENGELWLIDLIARKGNVLKKKVDDCAWAPNGNFLTYSDHEGIWIMDLENEKSKKLAGIPAGSWNIGLTWLPDGEHIWYQQWLDTTGGYFHLITLKKD